MRPKNKPGSYTEAHGGGTAGKEMQPYRTCSLSRLFKLCLFKSGRSVPAIGILRSNGFYSLNILGVVRFHTKMDHVTREAMDRGTEPALIGYSGYIRGAQHIVGKTYGDMTKEGYQYHPIAAYTKDPAVVERFQTMSLGSQGYAKISNRTNVKPDTKTNRLDDIEGCKPNLAAYRFTNKPQNHTIDGPRRLHPENPNKLDRSLNVDDIEGTKPKAYSFQTKRQTNPMAPDGYHLPGWRTEKNQADGIWQGKQTRNSNHIADIEGSTSKPVFRFKHARFNSEIHDIEGAQVGWKPRNERVGLDAPPRAVMVTTDISTKGRLRDASSDDPSQNIIPNRMTDTLQPVYTINGMTHTDDPLSKSKKLTLDRDGGKLPTYSLYTDDIEGAKAGYRPGEKKRRQYTETNRLHDIQVR
jgi:hypothetical protein